jgi:hypothetical protein
VDDQRILLAVKQLNIQHVKRIDRSNALDQRRFAVPIKRLQRKAARIDFPPSSMNLTSCLLKFR